MPSKDECPRRMCAESTPGTPRDADANPDIALIRPRPIRPFAHDKISFAGLPEVRHFTPPSAGLVRTLDRPRTTRHDSPWALVESTQRPLASPSHTLAGYRLLEPPSSRITSGHGGALAHKGPGGGGEVRSA